MARPEWVKKELEKPMPAEQPKMSESLKRRMEYPIGKKQ